MKHLAATTLLAIALAGATTGPACFAQAERPADGPSIAVNDASLENCSYIGVATSLASSLLREQLSLPKGVGIVIDDVDPNSPASHAGLELHDVIQKMDDQWVINVQQFSVLVRMKKPGDMVRLGVIRRGEPIDVKVTLAEKAMPVLEDSPAWPHGAPPIPHPGVGRVTGIVTHSDNVNTITIIARDDDRHVIIRERSTGNVIFDGPLNTPDDHAKLPPDLRDKVEHIETMSTEHLNELRGVTRGQDAPTNGD